MDINTENTLSEFKDILLDYLFDYKQELKNKWNNDEEILFADDIFNKFTPLLYGDWNRNPIENKKNNDVIYIFIYTYYNNLDIPFSLSSYLLTPIIQNSLVLLIPFHVLLLINHH